MKNLTSLADRCRWRRLKLGLTQADVAQRAGLSHVAIYLIENGTTTRPKHIIELANALQCDPSWLLFGYAADEKENKDA